ncbi:hypothetical protein M1L60_23515 [Actinoplanes sp. TRM 88003]|uniref:Uncharacterized protein n=1 Tax=Paractinoplanes aksuensis TaxID=2939490 RepID=A0ABT1DSU0_9ACTN|nr:hypothetical protein [Actinoplanes aksuensis]MCO8273568.1 hypothetical protein [Actinoplanes aksuensis]
MGKLYDFIESSGGIGGFNHPGRELLRFNDFAYDAGLRDQMVGLEMFNRGDDYLFDGWSDGQSSPLNACLNAGRAPQQRLGRGLYQPVVAHRLIGRPRTDQSSAALARFT